MRKFVKLFVLIGLIIGLASCQSAPSLSDIIDQVNITYSEEDSSIHVSQDVGLPTFYYGDENITFSWVSSHPEIIEESGTVHLPKETTRVTLTLTITSETVSETKDYFLTVIGTYTPSTVRFFVNDMIYESFEVPFNETIEPMDNPMLEGKTFVGWYINPEWTVAFDFNETIKDDTNVYARFDERSTGTLTVRYYFENISDDTYTLMDSSTDIYDTGIEIIIDEAIEGFEIDNNRSTTSGTVIENQEVVLDVFYTRLRYHVSYVSDEGLIDQVTYKHGETLIEPDEPFKEGHTFGGWSLSPSGNPLFVFGNPITQDYQLYAVWIFNGVYTGYYASINGVSDGQLLVALRNLISVMKNLSYSSTSYSLDDSDRDPNNPSKVILVYNRQSVSGTWDGGTTWNKEHVWPQSKLGTASDSDIHNLKPCNPGINSTRGNYPYAQGTGAYGLVTGGFFPGEQDKGDIARIVLYMHVRWGLTIHSSIIGSLEMFLQWHVQDPVDDFERNRNEVLYGVQNNRNPFIDHPEFAERLFGPIEVSMKESQTPFFLHQSIIPFTIYQADISMNKEIHF